MAKKPVKISKKSEKKLSNFGRFAFIVMSLIGVAVMWYLTDLHYDATGAGAACDISEKLSCGAVSESDYSEILGIPVSVLGIGYFLGILLVSLFKYNRKTLKGIAVVSILFLGPSLYLSILEATVIGSWCIFCEYSKIIMFGMVFAALSELRPEKFKKGHLKEAMIIAVVFALGTFFIQFVIDGESVPDGKYDEFATCLNNSNCKMYGSATCQFCLKQRQLFGSSFDLVGEIECDPRNPHSQADLCISKNIKKTPTWILEDGVGNELHRWDPGVVSLEELSEISGCPLPVEE